MQTGGSVMELETPSLVLDLDKLDRNLRRTAELAARAGVKLRPHIKTHKSVWIAKEQIRYGACGITVAKLGEAEVMADAGIDDILVAYPIVGAAKLQRLGKLMDRATVTVSTDDGESARGLSDLGEAKGVRVRVYVDVNTGLNRCGREPGEETAELVRRLRELPGVNVVGLMTHAGHVYGKANARDIADVARYEAESLLRTQALLAAEGMSIEHISVGSTPTSKYIGQLSGVTEMRPGAYVFGDGIQVSMGIIAADDCALTAAATVVGMPRTGTAIIDAGSKTVSTDVNPHRPGYGRLIGLGDDDALLERLSEEHGVVKLPDGVRARIGDRVDVIPNHCCTAANLHDAYVGVRNGSVERFIPIDARGKIR
jgi:D-serine deaminase-like pyridoxal phosphate-dependent protein